MMFLPDVKFEVEGGSVVVHAHKCIVASRSAVFGS
jgi:hypothetical protein